MWTKCVILIANIIQEVYNIKELCIQFKFTNYVGIEKDYYVSGCEWY